MSLTSVYSNVTTTTIEVLNSSLPSKYSLVPLAVHPSPQLWSVTTVDLFSAFTDCLYKIKQYVASWICIGNSSMFVY